MNILMMTNTFTPHVGGVARSVASFTEGYRALGHRVLVVAPDYRDAPAQEPGVLRIPAIQDFNGSDFSVIVTASAFVEDEVFAFDPDIIHSHHPFLVGSTALRFGSRLNRPVVFTHHTMYEDYTHYVPWDSEPLKRFVVRLSTSYANLCDLVFAPSDSIAETLRQRGVATPIEVVPTGVRRERFATGEGAALRERRGIPRDAPVVGHVGRLAPEKNLGFLAGAVARFLLERRDAHFLVAGDGPCAASIAKLANRAGVAERVHLLGECDPADLGDIYQAMDVFAFASMTETQGLVLAEAMTAGLPVVAVAAPGAREVVQDGVNGRLLPSPTEAEFSRALADIFDADGPRAAAMREAVAATAACCTEAACVDRALAAYERLEAAHRPDEAERAAWHSSLRRVRAEWSLLKGMARAAGAAARGAGA